jgi:hypothetical protein
MVKSDLHGDMQLTALGDYGRSRGIMWYYLGGFGLVHANDATNSRVIIWDSAT